MIRPGSALKAQKNKRAAASAASKLAPGKRAEATKPDLQEFLNNCDYVGATTLLEFERKARDERPNLLMWLAYVYFHNGEYRKALEAYDDAKKKGQ